MATYAPSFHQPVLLREVVDALNPRPEGVYMDATFGRGGHSAAILQALGPNGRLIALDRDPDAARFARMHFQSDTRFCFERDTFGRLAQVADRHRVAGRVQGILLDIGVSSPQFDDPRRGFSFLNDGPLDMRMDTEQGMSAAQWLAVASEEEISEVVRDLGEERFHRRIARAVVEYRSGGALDTTRKLARIVAAAVPTRERGKHPATRTFQAIRIFINGELVELKAALPQALQVLAPGGRLVVISFHSLEDRIVKRFMREQARGLELPLDLPVPAARESGATLRVMGRAVRTAKGEAYANPRSRSAVMRIAERLP